VESLNTPHFANILSEHREMGSFDNHVFTEEVSGPFGSIVRIVNIVDISHLWFLGVLGRN